MSVPTRRLLADTTLDSGTTTVYTGTNFAGGLFVASTGTATMNVVYGGYATNTYGYIGQYAGSLGTVTVSSGTWANSEQLIVGHRGVGTLNVSGGSVASGQGEVGAYNLGTATVSARST
jgi:T5SS/PEP-CTERM-associated repeat protein